jgi:hypothetical protein
MTSVKTIGEFLGKLWNVLKVLSVLTLLLSTIFSALVWIAINIFFPNSLALEIAKYAFIILIPLTGSTIIFHIYRRSVEKKIDELTKELTKIQELATQFQSFSDTAKKIEEKYIHYSSLFSIDCLNQNCKKSISIPIPNSLVKDIHYVDGRPTGKFLGGRELQIACEHCGEVFHIVYP